MLMNGIQVQISNEMKI